LSSFANVLAGIIPLLLIPPVVAYLALNFTGCTPYTSRTGVRTEIFRYIRVMVTMAGCGIILAILFAIVWFLGVA
ncbi:MAG: carbon monoxide dehydrogenase, partial [Methanoregulaceae archaeon]|nr:carbon monoxide dehydrogenase [Methanoregulaceae archaeon]